MASPAASPPSNLLTDVALAWASLQRARRVLQRMESKMDTPGWYRVSSQSCRSLELEQENQVSWGDWNSSGPVHAKKRMPHFPEDYKMAATSTAPWVRDPDGNVVTYNGQVAYLNPETFGSVRKEKDFNYKFEPEREFVANDQSFRFPFFIPIHSEDHYHFLRPLSSDAWRERSPRPLYSPASLQTWPMTGLRRSFPHTRLERLREKIQAQRNRHPRIFSSSCQTRSDTPQTLPQKHMPKRNVYKMKFAASNRKYPNQVLSSSPGPCDTQHAVSHTFTPKRKVYKIRFTVPDSVVADTRCQKEEKKVAQSCHGSGSRSPSPRRILKGHDAKLAGVSAWRKGQRLVRLLLGPPPTFLQLQNWALSGGLATAKESGPIEKSKKAECKSPPLSDGDNQKGAASLPGPQTFPETSVPVDCGHSEPLQIILNLLRNLQSHIQDRADNRRSRSQSPKGISTKKAGDSELHSKTQNPAVRRKTSPPTSEGKNLSSRTGSSGARKLPGKENARQGSQKKTDPGPPRPYTTAEVREFMNQKATERKRRCLEAKTSIKKAVELREKKLQEVYKKQREISFKKTKAKGSYISSKTIASARQSYLSKARTAKESQKEEALEHEKRSSGTVSANKELPDRISRDSKTPVTTGASESRVNSPLLVSASTSPGPLKQQDLDSSPSPPTLNLLSSEFENSEKAQVSVMPESSLPFLHKQARIRVLEVTAQVLKERIEIMNEKLNLPGVSGIPSDKSEKFMNIQSPNTLPIQGCPQVAAQLSCATQLLAQSSNLTASEIPGGPGPEVTNLPALGTPGGPGPEVTNLPVGGTPSSPGPEVTNIYTLKNLGGSGPEVTNLPAGGTPGSPGPEVTNLYALKTPGGPGPEVTNLPAGGTLGGSGPDVTNIPAWGTSRGPGPEVTNLPAGGTLGGSGPEVTNLPAWGTPRCPGPEVTNLPAWDTRKGPGPEMTSLPAWGTPGGPGSEVTNLPAWETPRCPGPEVTNLPAWETRKGPGPEVTSLPSWGLTPRSPGPEVTNLPSWGLTPRSPGPEVTNLPAWGLTPRSPGPEVTNIPAWGLTPRSPGPEVTNLPAWGLTPRSPGPEVTNLPAWGTHKGPGAEVTNLPARGNPGSSGPEVNNQPAWGTPRCPGPEVTNLPAWGTPRSPGPEVTNLPTWGTFRCPGPEVTNLPAWETPRCPGPEVTNLPAWGTPGGPRLEGNESLSGRGKGVTQESGKDGVEMEPKILTLFLSTVAAGEMLLSSCPVLIKKESPCSGDAQTLRPKDPTRSENSEVRELAPKDKKSTCPPGSVTRSSTVPDQDGGFMSQISRGPLGIISNVRVPCTFPYLSPQKESEKQDNFIDPSGTPKGEELTEFSPGTLEHNEENQTQILPSRRNEFLSPLSKSMEGYENLNKFSKDVCIGYVSSVQQKSLGFLQKLKLHQMKQEKELELLKQKAELEAEETQKSLDELLFRNHLKQSLYGCHNFKTELDNKAEKWKMTINHGDLDPLACLSRLSPMGRIYSSRANSPTVATWESDSGRSSLGGTEAVRGRGKQDCTISPQSITWSPSAAGYPRSKVFSKEDQMDSSQRNEINQSSLFDCFTLKMTDQYIREEELRAQYQAALLKLREKALAEKVTAELSWIEQQKACLGNKWDHSLMNEEQHRILKDLQQEQEELKHLQNIYEATHQERKLLLTQQKDILTIQQSTAHLQQEFHDLASSHQFSSPWSEAKEGQKPKAERVFVSERLVRSPMGLMSSISSDMGGSASILPDCEESLKCYEDTHLLAEREIRGLPDEDSCLQPQWLKGGKDRPLVSNMLDHRQKTLGQFVENDDQENKEPAEQYCDFSRGQHQESSLEIKEDPYQVIYNRKNQNDLGASSDSIKSSIAEPKEEKRRQQRKRRIKDKSREVQLQTVQICHNSAPQECKKDQEKKLEYAQYDENYFQKCDINPIYSSQSGSALSTHSQSISSDTVTSSCNLPSYLESGQSYLSFSEFQKATAFLVNISDSVISGSDSEAEGAQNTDVNEWQEFTDQQSLNELTSPLPTPSVTPSKGEGLILVVNDDEKQPDIGFPFGNCQDLQKTQGYSNISSKNSPSESNVVNLPGSRKQKLSLLWTELPMSQDIPSLKLSDSLSVATYVTLEEDKEKICSGHEVSVEPTFSSSSSLDDFSETDEDLEHQGSVFPLGTGKDQKDFRVKDVLLDGTSKKETEFLLPEISFMSLPPPKVSCQQVFLPFEMSQKIQNLSLQKTKPTSRENPEEGPISDKVSKSAFQHLSADFNSVPAKPGPRTFQDGKIVQLRYDEHKESDIHQWTSRGQGGEIPVSGSPTGLVPEIEHSSAMRADGSIHTRIDALSPLHAGTLSEIPSPVDEVLSYGSAGLPSPTQVHSSFPSEDFPSPPPPDHELWENDDIDFNSEDFPTLPEEVVFPEGSKNAQDEDSSIQTGELSSLSDEILPEEFSPIPLDLGNSYSAQDGYSLGLDGRRESSLDRKEEFLSLEPEQDFKRKQSKVTCWSSPTLCRSVSKSPQSFLKRSKDEDGKDSLSFDDTGNRLLMTHTQPETLKFKETSHFEGKHWSEMTLHKAKVDHKEDLERITYSEFNEFFRSDQMSYLLEDYTEKSSNHNNQDSFHYEPPLRSGECSDARVEYRFLERKPEKKFNKIGMSVAPEETHPERLTFLPTEMDPCFIYTQSESERLFRKDFSGFSSNHKEQQHMSSIKNESEKSLGDAYPMEEKEINFRNSVMGSKIDPRQKTYGIVDSVSTELTKKILWDALAVFAELTREQNVTQSTSPPVTSSDGGKPTMKTKFRTMPSSMTIDTTSRDYPYASDTEKGKMEF